MIRILYSVDCTPGLLTTPHQALEAWVPPVEALLLHGEALGVRLTLFYDVACLWRFRAAGLNALPEAAEAQARWAVARGHDVQLLLHPHWSFAELREEGFLFPPHTYLLGTLARDAQSRRQWCRETLHQAKGYLEALLQPVQPTYRCVAFRAGGFALQPDPPMVLEALAETGFLLDSSVVPGWRYHSAIQRIDYSHVPCQGNYWLSGAGGLTQAAPKGEGVYEIPVAAAGVGARAAWRVNGREALLAALSELLGLEPPSGDRQGGAGRWQRAWQRARMQLAQRFLRLELGAGSHRRLVACLQHYVQCLDARQPQLLCAFHAHPRNVTAQTLESLARFHWEMQRLYGATYGTTTFGHAATEIHPLKTPPPAEE